MVGGQDRRNEKRGYAPWTHYRCGGQHRLGAASCDAPYVAADRVERAVVGAVLDQVLTPENFQRLLAKMRAALADPAVADELRRLEGEMSRLRRLVGNLLDAVEDGGGQRGQGAAEGARGGVGAPGGAACGAAAAPDVGGV